MTSMRVHTPILECRVHSEILGMVGSCKDEVSGEVRSRAACGVEGRGAERREELEWSSLSNEYHLHLWFACLKIAYVPFRVDFSLHCLYAYSILTSNQI